MILGDAYGQMILEALGGDATLEIVERDDGFITASRLGPSAYLAPFRRWPARQRQAMRLVRGRVLDVGTGAGRVALHLQERRHEVVAIDNSTGAVEAARRRGVKDARFLAVEKVDAALGSFDTVVMFGNNLGLLGGLNSGRRLLRQLGRVTTRHAKILGETIDPYDTKDPLHLGYHRRNRKLGRMGGQIRIRVRYRELATPWFDYLFLSRPELETLARGTGWRLVDCLADEPPFYVGVLERG